MLYFRYLTGRLRCLIPVSNVKIPSSFDRLYEVSPSQVFIYHRPKFHKPGVNGDDSLLLLLPHRLVFFCLSGAGGSGGFNAIMMAFPRTLA